MRAEIEATGRGDAPGQIHRGEINVGQPADIRLTSARESGFHELGYPCLDRSTFAEPDNAHRREHMGHALRDCRRALFVFLGAHVLSTLEFRQLLCRGAVAPARLRLKSWLPAGEWV